MARRAGAAEGEARFVSWASLRASLIGCSPKAVKEAKAVRVVPVAPEAMVEMRVPAMAPVAVADADQTVRLAGRAIQANQVPTVLLARSNAESE
jgi:hypothetical protein